MSVGAARYLLSVLEKTESTIPSKDSLSKADTICVVKVSPEYEYMTRILTGLRKYIESWPELAETFGTWIRPSTQLQQALNCLEADVDHALRDVYRRVVWRTYEPRRECSYRVSTARRVCPDAYMAGSDSGKFKCVHHPLGKLLRERAFDECYEYTSYSDSIANLILIMRW